MGGYYGYYIIGGILSFIGMIVSSRLQRKFKKYSRVGLQNGMSGKEVAEAMLRDNNITDVRIVQGKGMLTVHYNPRTKTVSLSPEIYSGRSIMSAAVAAHECGHVVQHATSYPMLQLRSALVPVVSFASKAQQFLLIGAFMLFSTMPQLMLLTIAAFTATALFSFVTLPVEFDASKRALAWLDSRGITHGGGEQAGAKDALNAAAMTYVAAALSSFVMVVYLIMRYTSRN